MLSSASTKPIQSAQEPQRRSTIRFAPESSNPSQSRQQGQGSIGDTSHEGTPISKTDSHANRKYNTSDASTPEAAPQSLDTTPSRSEQTDSTESTKVESDTPWYKRVADKYGSITLENKASVARDHLALERTFLAWLRTSLSFASIGIAITQLFRLNSTLASRGTKRSLPVTAEGFSSSPSLPFSPLMGHTIPAEVLQYLQYSGMHSAPIAEQPQLGPTLLDQLLLLTAEGDPVESNGFSAYVLNNDTANKLKHVGKPLGATFIGISVVVLLVGFQRYFEAQHWIIQGKFPASRGSISLVTFAAFSLIIASLIVIIVISPTTYES